MMDIASSHDPLANPFPGYKTMEMTGVSSTLTQDHNYGRCL